MSICKTIKKGHNWLKSQVTTYNNISLKDKILIRTKIIKTFLIEIDETPLIIVT